MLTEGSLLQSQEPGWGLGTWRGRQQSPCLVELMEQWGDILFPNTPPGRWPSWPSVDWLLRMSRDSPRLRVPVVPPELELAGGSEPCFPGDPALVALGSSWNVDSEFGKLEHLPTGTLLSADTHLLLHVSGGSGQTAWGRAPLVRCLQAGATRGLVAGLSSTFFS